MKRIIVTVLGLAAVGLGISLYVNRTENPPVAAVQPEVKPVPRRVVDEARPANPIAPRPPQQRWITTETSATSNPAVAVSSVPTAAGTDDSSGLKQAIDVLGSSQASYAQKQAVWKQLREAGMLDQAVGELEKRVAGAPQNPDYQTALGWGYLQKAGTTQDITEQGIMGLKADKSFTAALAADPNHWEARFTMAVAKSYWPPQLNQGPVVIQQFETLIQQQEAQAPQPQFASTYLWLGNQYEKAGRNDDARAIWQRGAAMFPADATLAKKLGQ